MTAKSNPGQISVRDLLWGPAGGKSLRSRCSQSAGSSYHDCLVCCWLMQGPEIERGPQQQQQLRLVMTEYAF